MLEVSASHQYEGLDMGLGVSPCIDLQTRHRVLMYRESVLELDALHFGRRQSFATEVCPLGNSGDFDIQSLSKGLGEIVLIDDVAHGLIVPQWGSRHLYPQDGGEVVNGQARGIGIVAMRFVHQHDKVGQRGQIVVIARAEVLREAFHARCRYHSAFLGGLIVGVELGDIEDIDLDLVVLEELLVAPSRTNRKIVLARNHHRWIGYVFCQAFEYVLVVTRVAKVAQQLVVEREVGSEDEEMLDAVYLMQVVDGGSHQARLPYAGGDGAGQRGEVALKALERGDYLAGFFQFVYQEILLLLLVCGAFVEAELIRNIGNHPQALRQRLTHGVATLDLFQRFVFVFLTHRRLRLRLEVLLRVG